MEHDHEGQPRGLGVGLDRHHLVPAEERGEQHDVAQAGDGEELAHALDDAEHHRLEPGQVQLDLGAVGGQEHRMGTGHGDDGSAARDPGRWSRAL